MSLIDYEHLVAAGFPYMTSRYGSPRPERPPCLVPLLTCMRYELHGKRRGARKVRRYLRRMAQRNRASAIAQGFTYRTPTRAQRRLEVPIGPGRFIAPLFVHAPLLHSVITDL